MADEARDNGCEIVSLLPCARYEQYYWQYAMAEANAECLIRKRVKFIRASTGDRVAGNPYANCFVGWNVDLERFAEHFGRLGLVRSVDLLVPPVVEELPRDREVRLAAARADKARKKRAIARKKRARARKKRRAA
jgi:hypothetical protein